MVLTGHSVGSCKPENRIAEPPVDVRHGRARVIRNPNEGWNLHPGKQRQRMPLEPRSGDGGQWHREKKQIERRLNGRCCNADPAGDLRWGRSLVEKSPNCAQHGKGDHTQSQRFMEPAIEIAGS